jgi:hypothetical protein
MTVLGMPMSSAACWMAATACPSAAPERRLNDSVAAGNCD